MGYHKAGFEILGIDNIAQPHFPFDMFLVDALEFMDILLESEVLHKIDAIHASPPCQAYSQLKGLDKYETERPKLIDIVRKLCQQTGKPYIIENVTGAKHELVNPIRLCGQYFGLSVRRHRLFECSFPIEQPDCKPFHKPLPIGVYGQHPEKIMRKPGGGGYINRAHTLEMGQEAMGINWMNWQELTQAIPPVYTEYIGKQLLEWLNH